MLKLFIDADSSRLGIREKIGFFRQLGYLLKWWVGLSDTLSMIAESEENLAAKAMFLRILRRVREGKSLSNSLLTEKIFSSTDRAIIAIGEKTGEIPSISLRLADEYAFLHQTRQKFLTAIFYPAFLVLLSLGAVVALFVFILPSIFEIAGDFSVTQLPPLTRFLHAFSQFLTQHRISLIVVLLGLWLFLSAAAQTQSGRRALSIFSKKIPFFGQLIHDFLLLKRAKYFIIMHESGLSYPAIFQQLHILFHDRQFATLAEKLESHVRRGDSLSDAMQNFPHLLPPQFTMMIRVGEQTAQLGNAVSNFSEIVREDFDGRLGRIQKILEPVILVFVGWIVAAVAIGVFSLLLQIMEWVGL